MVEFFARRQTRFLAVEQEDNGSERRGVLSNVLRKIYTGEMYQRDVAERGFAIEEGVVEASAIDRLIESLLTSRAPRSRAGVRHAMQNAEVAGIARGEALLRMAREILGAEAIPFRATLFDKSPVSNWLVAWHQDTALPLLARHEIPGWGPWSVKDGVTYAHAPASALSQVLALRLHLDDSLSENGPLRVLPATHALGVLSDEEMLRLAREVAASECLVRRGGVLAMRPLIVHASSKSHSALPRRVLHIEYAAQQITQDGMALAIS